MVKLHTFGKRKRVYRTSIDRDHDHLLKLGRVRTYNSKYYDEIAQLNGSIHHHPIRYDATVNPTIGNSEGHNHIV